MWTRWLMVYLTLFYAADNAVYSSHFRGGVIMVKPKVGGASKEV